jgi:hypothetical protein
MMKKFLVTSSRQNDWGSLREIAEQSSAKRKAEAKLAAVDQAKKPYNGSPAAKILVESYWDSSESKRFFLGDSNDERDVVKVLELRIERLQQANKTSGGWRDIIDISFGINISCIRFCFPLHG